MTSLRKLAEGQDCTVRLQGCNHDATTTVLAHFRLADVSGMGMKSPDFCAAFSCSACHLYCDTHHDEATQLAHLRGVIRTLAKFVEMGVVQVKGTRERKYTPSSKVFPRRRHD